MNLFLRVFLIEASFGPSLREHILSGSLRPEGLYTVKVETLERFCLGVSLHRAIASSWTERRYTRMWMRYRGIVGGRGGFFARRARVSRVFRLLGKLIREFETLKEEPSMGGFAATKFDRYT